MDIICVSTTDWDEIWGSRQQIMSRLAAIGHRVLFIQRQAAPENLLRDSEMKLRKLNAWKETPLINKSNNLWLFEPPLMLPGRYYSHFINNHNQKTLARNIYKQLRVLKFQEPILWVYPPYSAPLLKILSEKISVYHCIEHFAGRQLGRKRKIIQSEEKELLQNVDIVFTHSQGLRDKYQNFTKRPIVLTPSAADVKAFQTNPTIHPALASITRPRIGLIGTLDNRIDVSLLQRAACSHTEWNIVLIGKLRTGNTNFEQLRSKPNIYFLGQHPNENLPSLLSGLDVLLIPYLLNDLTEYISPIKFYEYLSTGKPIVTTDLPELRKFSKLIRISTPERFIHSIEDALRDDSPEIQKARQEEAQKHTWENRIKVMWQTIDEVIKDKNCASH